MLAERLDIAQAQIELLRQETLQQISDQMHFIEAGEGRELGITTDQSGVTQASGMQQAAAAAAAAAAGALISKRIVDVNTLSSTAVTGAGDSRSRMRSAARRLQGRILKGGGGSGDDDDGWLGESPFCSPRNPETCAEYGGSCAYFNQSTAEADFDSVMNAVMAITQIVTFDTWSASMYDLQLAVSPHVWFYFAACAMIGGFFIVNLFLAVVFDEFMRSKATESAKAELLAQEATARTAAEAEATLLARARIPDLEQFGSRANDQKVVGDGADGYHRLSDEPDGSIDGRAQGGCRCLRPLVTSQSFLYVTLSFLVINVVIMCMPYAGQSEAYARTLHFGSTIFASLFVFEILLRICGIGCAEFMSDGWNQVCLSRAPHAPF